MSNNPGKRGKPAPWIKRAQEHRRSALEQFIREHHSSYDAHCVARGEAVVNFRKIAEAKFPGFGNIGEALKEGDRLLHRWDRDHASPLKWEERVDLEKRFDEQYENPDFS